jgi:hypothetical protein
MIHGPDDENTAKWSLRLSQLAQDDIKRSKSLGGALARFIQKDHIDSQQCVLICFVLHDRLHRQFRTPVWSNGVLLHRQTKQAVVMDSA